TCHSSGETVCYPDPTTSTRHSPEPPGQVTSARTQPSAKGTPMPVPSSMRPTLVVLGIALTAVPASVCAQAQATTGVIRGTVTDSAGAPLAGASVTLRN